MNRLLARLRRRFRPLHVTVWRGEEQMFTDESAVKVKRRGIGVSVWTVDDEGVTEWWYPFVDEVWITR